MTTTLKSEKVNKIYLEVIQEKLNNNFTVRAFREVGGLYGYPIKENTYTTEAKATRRFNDLKRKATNNEL